jgi:hypothetical protein
MNRQLSSHPSTHLPTSVLMDIGVSIFLMRLYSCFSVVCAAKLKAIKVLEGWEESNACPPAFFGAAAAALLPRLGSSLPGAAARGAGALRFLLVVPSPPSSSFSCAGASSPPSCCGFLAGEAFLDVDTWGACAGF